MLQALSGPSLSSLLHASSCPAHQSHQEPHSVTLYRPCHHLSISSNLTTLRDVVPYNLSQLMLLGMGHHIFSSLPIQPVRDSICESKVRGRHLLLWFLTEPEVEMGALSIHSPKEVAEKT